MTVRGDASTPVGGAPAVPVGGPTGLDAGYLRLRELAVTSLGSWAAPDGRQEELRQDYLRHLRREDGACAKSGPPAHLTVGALVVAGPERVDGTALRAGAGPMGVQELAAARVLLVLHGKARRWFQPGGHLEPDDADLLAAARREATEETGLTGLVFDPEPLQLERHALSGVFGTCREHLDVRFLALAPRLHEVRVSAESDDVRWWPVDDVPEPSVAGLVAAGLARLRDRAPTRP